MSAAFMRKKLPTFSPTTLSGCQVWFDAADPTTITAPTGSVTAWNSKGAATMQATPPGTAPTYVKYNGYPAISFNGTSTKLTTGTISSFATTGTTWISVAVNLTPVTSITPVDSSVVMATNGTAPEKSIRFASTTFATVYSFNTSTFRGETANNTNGIRGFIDTAATFNTYTNGTNTYSTSTAVTFEAGSNQSLVMGQWNTGWLNGFIFELIIYNRALSLSEYQQVEAYLAQKWGYTGLLPATHPGQLSIIVPNVSKSYARPTLYSVNFQPIQVTGCILWLDAADSAATAAVGSTITSWRDKSVSANHFTVTSGTATVTLDGGYTVLSVPNGTLLTSTNTVATTSTTTIFTVFKGTSASLMMFLAFSGLLSGDLSIRMTSYIIPTSSGIVNDLFYGLTAYFDGTAGSSATMSAYHIVSGTMSTSGTTAVTISSTAFSSGRMFSGNVAEVIFYSVPLTTAQRQTVESYLASKWGLVSKLPATHPHFTTPAGLPSAVSISRNLSSALVNLAIIIGNATLGRDYTITTDGTYLYYNFFTTGTTMTLTNLAWGSVKYLVLGGGGGGCRDGGGGGAGGCVQGTGLTLPAGQNTVQIGAGGAEGVNGSSTVFGSFTAYGGGVGGGALNGYVATSGGCGGGGAWPSTVPAAGSQGYAGGVGNGCQYAEGGGGGLGGAGGNATSGSQGGNGGVGISWDIGFTLALGGGGSGSSYTGSGAGTASHGGGTAGVNGTNGTANTGGGGGGGSWTGTGGAGGSGFVSVGFLLANVLTPRVNVVLGNVSTGDYTVTSSAGYTFFNFLATGKTMTFTTYGTLMIRYMAIGGGGSGGTEGGGGGGGAGGLQTSMVYVLTGGVYNIVIGAGGAAISSGNGNNGNDTIFGPITAYGGGCGGRNSGLNAGNGGCGGGGIPAGTASQGFAGGSGGGGGCGAQGGNRGSGYLGGGGAGGAGVSWNNGTALTLGGGGGEGSGNAVVYAGGVGGSGGGGNGAGVLRNQVNATSGTVNTGGGGGGAGDNGTSSTSGAGGSGFLSIGIPTIMLLPIYIVVSVGNAALTTDYTVTTYNGYTFFNFLATGKTMTLTVSAPTTVMYMAIGGGGAGGGACGSGGGAGGYITGTSALTSGTTYSIVIGAGGSLGGGGYNAGSNGGSSSFNGLTANGGGGGSGYVSTGSNGGCGGGSTNSTYSTASQGFCGGIGGNVDGTSGGGGGGTTSVGLNGGLNSAGGNGGVGTIWNNGTAIQLGGGGGGGGANNPTNGGVGTYGGGSGARGIADILATPGTPNTGGGGGGGGSRSGVGNGIGAVGGSGFVSVAFLTSTLYS